MLCTGADYGRTLHTKVKAYVRVQVTVNGTVMTTVEDNNTCGYIWTEVGHDGHMYHNLNCPASDPCPVRCQVPSPPPCTHPEDPSNSPATFWICFVLRIWWKIFLLSGYSMLVSTVNVS